MQCVCATHDVPTPALPQADLPVATRLQRATAQLSAAAKRGADIAMLPERWAESPAAALAYKRLAAELGMAIGATYTAPWPIDPSFAAGLVRFVQSVSQFTC